MPFASKAQARAAFGGYIPGFSKKRAKDWAAKTDFTDIPDHVKKAMLVEVEKLCALISAAKAVAPSLRPAGMPAGAKAFSQSWNASKASRNGRFNGMMTSGALKPPGLSAANQTMNPRLSLRSAMTPKTRVPGES